MNQQFFGHLGVRKRRLHFSEGWNLEAESLSRVTVLSRCPG